jgi:hypothetical protein
MRSPSSRRPLSGFAQAVQTVSGGRKARANAAAATADGRPPRVDVLPRAPVPVGRDLSFLFHTTERTPTVMPIPARTSVSLPDSFLDYSGSGCVSAASPPLSLPLPVSLVRPVAKPASAHTSPGRPPAPPASEHRPLVLPENHAGGGPRAKKSLVYPPLHPGHATATAVVRPAFAELIQLRRRGPTDRHTDWPIELADAGPAALPFPPDPLKEVVVGAPFSFAHALQTFQTAQRGNNLPGVSQTLFDDDD